MVNVVAEPPRPLGGSDTTRAVLPEADSVIVIGPLPAKAQLPIQNHFHMPLYSRGFCLCWVSLGGGGQGAPGEGDSQGADWGEAGNAEGSARHEKTPFVLMLVQRSGAWGRYLKGTL
jgi:hypothetical protein